MPAAYATPAARRISASVIFLFRLLLLIILLILIIVLVALLIVFNADKLLEGYASSRVAIWLKLLTGEDLTADEKQASGWQSLQSLYAIGSGGLFGLGFGNSKQKHMYLPEPQNDFIFPVICEELGFVGAAAVLILFAALIARAIKTSSAWSLGL